MNASAVCTYRRRESRVFQGTRTGAHAQTYATCTYFSLGYHGGRRLVSICRHRSHQCFVFTFNRIFTAICHFFLQFECTWQFLFAGTGIDVCQNWVSAKLQYAHSPADEVWTWPPRWVFIQVQKALRSKKVDNTLVYWAFVSNTINIANAFTACFGSFRSSWEIIYQKYNCFLLIYQDYRTLSIQFKKLQRALTYPATTAQPANAVHLHFFTSL